MRLFAKSEPPHRTALAMIGANPGQAIVVLGADGPLAAAIGLVTGLNGRMVIVDHTTDAATRVQSAADEAGALVEFIDASPMATTLAEAAFDLVVVRAHLAARPASDRGPLIVEACRLVRPGSRIVVVEGTAKSGLFGTREAALDASQIETLLAAAGARAVRQLAETDGVIYFEARR